VRPVGEASRLKAGAVAQPLDATTTVAGSAVAFGHTTVNT
jgi:hypothetical protein